VVIANVMAMATEDIIIMSRLRWEGMS
jgi:hypothetical protein